MNHVEQAGEQLLGLTNDVLDLSRIEAGEMQLQLDPFESLPLIDSVLLTVKPQADAKGLALVADVAPRVPPARAAGASATAVPRSARILAVDARLKTLGAQRHDRRHGTVSPPSKSGSAAGSGNAGGPAGKGAVSNIL